MEKSSDDIPIECAYHSWLPFLSYNFDLKLSSLCYYRICEICGRIELRDKMKEHMKNTNV